MRCARRQSCGDEFARVDLAVALLEKWKKLAAEERALGAFSDVIEICDDDQPLLGPRQRDVEEPAVVLVVGRGS